MRRRDRFGPIVVPPYGSELAGLDMYGNNLANLPSHVNTIEAYASCPGAVADLSRRLLCARASRDVAPHCSAGAADLDLVER